MLGGKSNGAITAQLLLVMLLWGGNNVGLKFQLLHWPPVFTVSTRFLAAGFLLLAAMRWTNWLGQPALLAPNDRRRLWTSGALSLSAYIVVFVWALKWTSSSAVALMMATSPVWALVWEERLNRYSAHRYAAALLALAGVAVLFKPSLNLTSTQWIGNLLGLGASILWTIYSRQTRTFGPGISGLELTGQMFWRAGIFLTPVALVEIAINGVRWNLSAAGLQVYSVLLSGLVAFALWNNALRVWPASRAFLFGNLIPITTMGFAYVFLGETITASFWTALGLVVSAVLIGQTDWPKILARRG